MIHEISTDDLRRIIEHSFLAGRNKFVSEELPKGGGLHPPLPGIRDWQEARVWSTKLLEARGVK